MSVATFSPQPGFNYQMVVREDRMTSLLPHSPGFLLPIEFAPASSAPGKLTWDISYLYAELWSTPEDGRRLISFALPEFTTDSHRPPALRFPLTAREVAMLEELRQGGDLCVVLHLQATMVGTIPRDQLPDPARRQMLEAVGVENELFGPIRSSHDLTLRIPRWAWEEEVLPQWRAAELRPDVPAQVFMGALNPLSWALAESVASNLAFDIRALARTLQGATGGADLEELISQCRAPIVGL